MPWLRRWCQSATEMAWLRGIGAAAALVVVAVGALGCGGGEERAEVGPSDVEAVVASALEALLPPGQVLHLKATVKEDGELRPLEIWIDGDNQRGRRETVYGEKLREVSVSDDWQVTSYDPWANSVHTWSLQDYPVAEGLGDNPALIWVFYVWIMGSADELAVVGSENVGGHQAIVVNIARIRREPLGDQEPGTDRLKLALDAQSLLPIEVEWRFVSTAGEESLIDTVSYEVAEYLSPGDLPSDLFSPQSLNKLVSPE